MKEVIAVINQHPTVANNMIQAIAGVGDLDHVARIVSEKCKEHRIAEFTNPFKVGDPRRDQWNAAFNEDEEARKVGLAEAARSSQEPEDAEPEPEGDADDEVFEDEDDGEGQDDNGDKPDFESMTKEDIEQWVLDATGENLDTRKMSKDQMVAHAGAIWESLAEGDGDPDAGDDDNADDGRDTVDEEVATPAR